MPDLVSHSMISSNAALLSQPMMLVPGFRKVIKELMPLCPVCERSCRGHKYLELGRCSEANAYERMIHLFRRHSWSELAKLASQETTPDSLTAFVLRGEHPLATIALVSNPPAFYASSWILLQQVIPAHEVLAIESCGLHDWRPV